MLYHVQVRTSATATPRQISEDLRDRGTYIYDVVSEGEGDGI